MTTRRNVMTDFLDRRDWKLERFDYAPATCACGCGELPRHGSTWLNYDQRFFHSDDCLRKFRGLKEQQQR